MTKKKSAKRDIYQEVTNQIIGYLEAGTAPWRNPIAQGTGDGWPKNLLTGNRYRGINVPLLSMRTWAAGYSSDYWLTYKQALLLKGQVRKDEKGSLVTFWKLRETQDKETGEPTKVPVLRYFTAFNLEQIDGIEIPDAPVVDPCALPFEPVAAAEKIAAGYVNPPVVKHDGGQRAFYRIRTDSVHMPTPESFDRAEDYHATLFHELSHSTGAAKRLNRKIGQDPAPFGSPDYSREELIAELSASFLCAAAKISPPTIEQSAAYLKGWIDVLKGDKRLIVSAAGAAQKSADLILGDAFWDAADEASVTSSEKLAKPDRDTRPPSQLDLF